MAIARAFPLISYDPDTAGDRGKLLAPPYDVVNDEQRDELIADQPHQSMRIELPEGGDPKVSSDLLTEWLDEGVLEAGEVGVAVVRQRFVGPDGVRRTRTAVCCEVGLSPFGQGEVLPHERTFDAPRRMRTELMRATKANISPVFLAYHDPSTSIVDMFASITDDEPDFTSIDGDGTQTAVWYVTDPALCEVFERAVEPHALLIADGHHRYTAALEYQSEVTADAPKLVVAGGTEHVGPPHTSSSWQNGVLAMVVNSADPGICVFPTHRVLKEVDGRRLDSFVVEAGALEQQEFGEDVASAVVALEAVDADTPAFVAFGGGRGARLLTVPDELDMQLAAPDSCDAARKLDVLALHSLVIDGGAVLADHSAGTTYTRSLTEAIAAVEADSKGTLAFLMRGADPARIHEVAEAGELLPQKSTYYFPKVPTGVAFRAVDPALLGLG